MENRTPIRKKAVETRNRLLAMTVEVVAKKGYHNTTVDDIAKACGVSTGSAYRYFQNKKEMMLAALEYSFVHIQSLSGTEDDILMDYTNMDDMLSFVLEQFYMLHKKYERLHEELESLRHIDKDFAAVYDKITENAVEMLIKKCPEEIAEIPNFKERLYIGIGILENFAHMQMNENVCRQLDMDCIKRLSISSAMSLVRESKGGSLQ